MGLDGDNETPETKLNQPRSSVVQEDSGDERLSRQPSEASCYATEEEEEEARLQLGPKCSIKEHLEKDKDDESLRRWKEQLLGSVDVASVGETLEPDVKILSLTILCPGRPDIVLEIPDSGDPKGVWFTLKEGTHYHLRFSIKVSNNIVSGLRYTNTVWKTGLKVDSSKEMLGTFSPQPEPYIHEMPEETTPLVILQEDRTQQEQSLLMTTTSATWKSTTHSVSRKNGWTEPGISPTLSITTWNPAGIATQASESRS